MKNIKPILLLLGLFAANVLVAQNVEFENIQIVNEENLDFSPVPYGSGLMYTSAKSDRFPKCPPQGADDYTDLFFSGINDDGSFQEPVVLKGGVNGKYNDGVPTFDPTGNTMLFTRNNMLGKNTEDIIDLKIYKATLADGKWVDVTPLPFNSDDWSTAHPALSADGKLLIFSSNRPGSMGGSMDLWGTRMEDGVWSIPFNLGPDVNTDGIEIFPYIDSDGNLFYSSNRAGGEGGLDIYAATNAAPGSIDEWAMAGNIGSPFNTPSDEVAFVPIAGATEGYLASSHTFSGAEGEDDIYRWDRESDLMDAVIQVVDKASGEPLADSDLSIEPSAFKNASYQKYGPVLDLLYGTDGPDILLEAVKLKTDSEGKVKIRVYPGSSFNMLAEKNGYDPENRNPTTENLVEKDVYVIPLQRKFATLIVKVVEDTPEGLPIPTPNISIRNKRTGEVIPLTGDPQGEGRTQIDCNDDYEITASKEPYETNSAELSDYEVDCEDGEVVVTVRLKKPLTVILEPIFYSFDRYYIRKRDAAPTLDSLVSIMNKYPSLNIRLDAHTDSRGTDNYNVILSQNRANAAEKYLVKRGISPDRITTKDYGETKPINNCTDEVFCSEADHQLNRRVDVTATSHNVPNTIFQTRDVSKMNVVSDR